MHPVKKEEMTITAPVPGDILWENCISENDK
jgi:hypothetical protein